MKIDARLILRVIFGVGLALLVPPRALRAAEHHAGASRRIKRGAEVSKPTRAVLTPEVQDKLRDLLAGTDQPAALAAAKALSESTASNAAVPLVEVLSVGAAPPLVSAVLDALRKLSDPQAIDVLALYTGHRNPDIRRRAVEALSALSDARVVPTLVERMGDGAPDVRAAAAEALATRGEKTAAPRMFGLLKRNDSGAAAPLGTLAPVSLVPAIAELQGSVDDANLATAMGELLKRPDMPEPVRVDIIKTLARVPGAASTTALVEFVGILSARDAHPSRAEAQKVIDERAKQP